MTDPCQHTHASNGPWEPGPCTKCGLPWAIARAIIDFEQHRQTLIDQVAYCHSHRAHNGDPTACDHQPCAAILASLHGTGETLAGAIADRVAAMEGAGDRRA